MYACSSAPERFTHSNAANPTVYIASRKLDELKKLHEGKLYELLLHEQEITKFRNGKKTLKNDLLTFPLKFILSLLKKNQKRFYRPVILFVYLATARALAFLLLKRQSKEIR